MKESSIIYPLKCFSYNYDGPLICYGNNMYLCDENGKKYLDAISGLWNVSFGHTNREINERVNEQLKQISYINMISMVAQINEKYANNLIELVQDTFSRLIYTCSGSESIECAIKIARKYQRIRGELYKNKIVIFDMSYHGTTYAAMSASGMDVEEITNYAPVVDGFIRLKTPFILQGENKKEISKQLYLENLKKVFQEHDDIAAVLMEPIIGSGGIITIPDWYIEKLSCYTKERDILLIFDEVATGFGRTGSYFRYNNLNVQPDIMCLSKSINNGVIPMGAVLINKNIEEKFISNNQYIEHFSTQNGNALACAAASAVLGLLKNKQLLIDINDKGTYLKEKLKEQLEVLPIVREIRGVGLMIGIDLVDKKGIPLTLSKLESMEKIIRSRGLLVYPFSIEGVTGGFSLFPFYYMSIKEADRIVSILFKVLSKEI